MKILSVVGARPQFIKAAPVSKVLRQQHNEILVHTGQHYDYGMSAVFFSELDIPEPNYNLSVGSGSHAQQTGQMLIALESLMLKENPDWVLVYGDTNSTLAGAVAASKLNIRLAHVEAGLRSFNRIMPEEVNRVLTDHCADLLFCPTQNAVAHLREEGIIEGVHLVGDVMYDALLSFLPRVDEKTILHKYNIRSKDYILATVHRASNTDNAIQLQAVLDCLSASPWAVIFPAHPRTLKAMQRFSLKCPTNVTLVEPVGYLTMLALQKNARFIMTDSGGVQKEAFLLGTPCLTLRNETEWEETSTVGWNHVVGINQERIAHIFTHSQIPDERPQIFGDGQAAQKILKYLESQ